MRRLVSRTQSLIVMSGVQARRVANAGLFCGWSPGGSSECLPDRWPPKLSRTSAVSDCFEDACCIQPAIAQDTMAMDDKVVSDMLRREELWLIRSFLSITDPSKRQRVLELAEQLAEDAASDPAGLAFASIEASPAETPKDVPARTE
jgi:hypothetical protein